MPGKARLKGETPQQTRTRLLAFSVFGLKYGKSEPKTSEKSAHGNVGGLGLHPLSRSDIIAVLIHTSSLSSDSPDEYAIIV
jgi:hypothetical protein